MILALLYRDHVKDTISLVGNVVVHQEDDAESKLNDMLVMAKDHAKVTQPDYDFDWGYFLSDQKAWSEDEDYVYQVVHAF